MKIKMVLLSDTIFGDGNSIPGEEDISVLTDEYGFPYYKGGSFKGVFREELEHYLELTGDENRKEKTDRLLGVNGNNDFTGQLFFSDFRVSPAVRATVLKETGRDSFSDIRDSFTNLRTFTAIDENGIVSKGSLRVARCVDKGLVFYGTIDNVSDEDCKLIMDVLGMIKWIGTMRNRGFGKVKIERED